MVWTYFTFFFFFSDPATTEIYTYSHYLSLPDALPISGEEPVAPSQTNGPHGSLSGIVVDGDAPVVDEQREGRPATQAIAKGAGQITLDRDAGDRKSTRLNSSH